MLLQRAEQVGPWFVRRQDAAVHSHQRSSPSSKPPPSPSPSPPKSSPPMSSPPKSSPPSSPERAVANVDTSRRRAGLPQCGHTGSGDESLGHSADDRLPH